MESVLKFNHLGSNEEFFVTVEDIDSCVLVNSNRRVGVIILKISNPCPVFIPCSSYAHSILIKDQIEGVMSIERHVIQILVDEKDVIGKCDLEDGTIHMEEKYSRQKSMTTKPLDYGITSNKQILGY